MKINTNHVVRYNIGEAEIKKEFTVKEIRKVHRNFWGKRLYESISWIVREEDLMGITNWPIEEFKQKRTAFFIKDKTVYEKPFVAFSLTGGYLRCLYFNTYDEAVAFGLKLEIPNTFLEV